MVIVVIAYHHIYVDASNHYAPEPSVVFPTVTYYKCGYEFFTAFPFPGWRGLFARFLPSCLSSDPSEN